MVGAIALPPLEQSQDHMQKLGEFFKSSNLAVKAYFPWIHKLCCGNFHLLKKERERHIYRKHLRVAPYHLLVIRTSLATSIINY